MRALYIAGLAISLLSTLGAMTVSAYSLEYTYTSDKLPLEAVYINSELSDTEVIIEEERLPAFGFSFSLPNDSLASDTPTVFSMDNTNVWVDPSFFGLTSEELQSTSSGNVFINPDGSIASWRVVFQLSTIITPTSSPWAELENYRINISSAGGENTCNCDIFENFYNLTTQRQDIHIIAADVQTNFKTDNDIDNWSVNEASVPEPQSWSLMLAGLFSIYALRLRRKITQRSARGQLKNELTRIT